MARILGALNKKTLEERFIEKIVINSETLCWEYQTQTPNPPFYVNRELGKKNVRHVSWYLYSGEFINAVIEVTCNNRFCVNPEHFLIVKSWQDRFWYYVDKECSNIFYGGTRCWEWKAKKDDKGYGLMNHPYSTKAHRLSWLIHNGIIPDGLLICHKCDNPSCVNPNHLFLGTSLENNLDKVSKGRQKGAEGTRNFGAVLNDEQVDAIRFLYKSKEYSTYKLSRIFQVSRDCISKIVNNKTWRHV